MKNSVSDIADLEVLIERKNNIIRIRAGREEGQDLIAPAELLVTLNETIVGLVVAMEKKLPEKEREELFKDTVGMFYTLYDSIGKSASVHTFDVNEEDGEIKLSDI